MCRERRSCAYSGVCAVKFWQTVTRARAHTFLSGSPVMPTKGKGRASRPDQQVYAHALPLVHLPSTTLFARSLSLLRLHVVSIENPHCVGIFDEPSRSVWIVNARDRDILWRRGFFGKGNLSRSEPSWLNRRLNQLGGTKGELSLSSVLFGLITRQDSNLHSVSKFLRPRR